MQIIPFPGDRIVLAFFGARFPDEVQCLNCSLVSEVYQWTHVTLTVTKRHRNSLGLRLNSINFSKVDSRLCLLSGVSKCDTYRADSFLILKILCKIGHTRSFEIDVTLSSASWIGGLSIRDRGAESPYTTFKRSLISLRNFPSESTDIGFSQFFWNPRSQPFTHAVKIKFRSLYSTILYFC